MKINEFVNAKGEGAYTHGDIDRSHKARFDSKMDSFSQWSLDDAKGILITVGGYGQLKKARIKIQNVAHRPLFCFGPECHVDEITFLLAAREVQTKWRPKDALDQADGRRLAIKEDPNRSARLREDSKPTNGKKR